MLVTIKTLQQQTLTIDIDESKTVLELKKEIENKKGSTDYPVAGQKLIYSGKILSDESPLKEYNIEENKFVVVMVTKPKTTAQASNETAKSTEQSSSTITKSSTDEAKEKSTAKTDKKEPITTTPATTRSTSSPTSQLASVPDPASSSSELEGVILNIMEMGYPRDRVENALQASFNNPDRAVDYLISGNIPSMEDELLNEQLQNLEASSPTRQQSGAQDPNSLEFLRNQPQFQQLCQVVQQNPNLLNTIMQQLRTTNPQLLNLITQNQEEFVRMLNEPIAAGQQSTPAATTTTNPATGTAAPATQPSSNVSASGQLHLDSLIGSANVTTQDKEAIERLKALGFEEYLVVQAYFACEKNESLAANFLLTQLEGD